MKNYNEVIKVEVSVNNIANQLLGTMESDNKHRESITETIISSLLEADNHGLSHLYNSLNGYSNDIEFNVGDEVICSSETYQYVGDTPKTDDDGNVGVTTWKRQYSAIGACEVIDVNINKDNKVKVRFTVLDRDGKEETITNWVSHLKCDKIVVSA